MLFSKHTTCVACLAPWCLGLQLEHWKVGDWHCGNCIHSYFCDMISDTGVAWRPTWGWLQEIHIWLICLRFLETWWLGRERENYQAELFSWPSLSSHTASLQPYSIVWGRHEFLPRFKRTASYIVGRACGNECTYRCWHLCKIQFVPYSFLSSCVLTCELSFLGAITVFLFFCYMQEGVVNLNTNLYNSWWMYGLSPSCSN